MRSNMFETVADTMGIDWDNIADTIEITFYELKSFSGNISQELNFFDA